MLETVSTFKYLGLLLTSDLSWSKHIEGVCTKKKILGLLYRRFYQNADVKLFTNYTFPLYNPTESMQLFYSSS